MELAPGALRAYRATHDLASSLRAVPQHEELRIGLEDGWECWLKRYKYCPLTRAKEIRLLRLHPRKDRLKTDDGSVMPRCELINASLVGTAEYAAVSYTWGELDQCSPILLQEEDCLCITNSLFEVLCRLSSDEPLDFWVDQLCINQHDLAERGEQVQLMSEIFQQALMTFVWLGNGDDTSRAAFDLIGSLSHSGLTLLGAFNFLSEANLSGLQEFFGSQGIDHTNDESGWTAIEQLSLRPWFSRLWTFQEVVVSKDVVFLCGTDSCSHDDLLRAFYVTQLVRSKSTTGMSNTQLTRLNRGRYLSGHPKHLLDLLLETSDGGYDCADPHDRVYAVLALQGKQGKCNVSVDYRQPIENLYLNTARSIIIDSQSLRLLHRRRFGVLEHLPSWAPDWSCENSDDAINDDRMGFSCSNGLRHGHEKSSSQSLVVRGKVVTRITKMAAHNFAEHWSEYQQRNIRSWLGDRKLIPPVTLELERRSSNIGDQGDRKRYIKWLLAMTLTCGRFRQEDGIDFNAGDTETYTDLPEVIEGHGPSFVRSLQKCGGRKVAILDSDKFSIGLVPDFARRDDLVCVVHGSTTPLILRKTGKDHEFIGECYIHGIMYGEAVDGLEGDRFTLR